MLNSVMYAAPLFVLLVDALVTTIPFCFCSWLFPQNLGFLWLAGGHGSQDGQASREE